MKNKKLHKCPICLKSFGAQNSLNLHTKIVHEKIKQHTCSICFRSFGIPANLKKHTQSVHENVRVTCEICQKEFKAQSLKTHIKTAHEKIKEHNCSICLKSFGLAQSLKRHIEIVHEKMKNHFCQVCQKGFGSKENLNIHVKTVHENINLLTILWAADNPSKAYSVCS